MKHENKHNWSADAENDVLSGDVFFESVNEREIASTKSQLAYLASIAKALVEIRDELRKLNDK